MEMIEKILLINNLNYYLLLGIRHKKYARCIRVMNENQSDFFASINWIWISFRIHNIIGLRQESMMYTILE